jgi:hypothetical protein
MEIPPDRYTFSDVIEFGNHSCCHDSAVPAGKISCGSAADSEDIEVNDSDVARCHTGSMENMVIRVYLQGTRSSGSGGPALSIL